MLILKNLLKTFRGSRPKDKADSRILATQMPPAIPKISGEAAIRRTEHLDNLIRHTLTSYLDESSNMSLTEAVEQVNENWDESTTFCIVALTVPLDIALHTHYSSPSHKKLAEFMVALAVKRREILDLQNYPNGRGPNPLGNFSIYIYDTFESNLPDGLLENVDDNNIPDPEDPSMYVNLCAFLAQNLWADGHFCYTQARYALTSLTEIKPTASVEEKDAWIMGAAVFIVHQAGWIWGEVVKEIEWREEISREEQARKPILRGKLGSSGRKGRAADIRKHHDFTWAGWVEWRTAFEEAAVDEAYGQACRDLAKRAADIMALKEKTRDINAKFMES